MRVGRVVVAVVVVSSRLGGHPVSAGVDVARWSILACGVSSIHGRLGVAIVPRIRLGRLLLRRSGVLLGGRGLLVVVGAGSAAAAAASAAVGLGVGAGGAVVPGGAGSWISGSIIGRFTSIRVLRVVVAIV